MKVIEPADLGGKVTLYTYDKAGNRLTEAVTAGAETTNTSNSYNELNRLMKTLTKKPDGVEETTKYTYDSNGNMIYKEVEKLKPAEETVIPTFSMFIIGETENELGTFGALFKYDEFNQLVSTTSGTSTATYQYNGEGYRVTKSKDGQITKYLYEYDKVVLELDGNGNQIAKNVYGLNLVSRTVEAEKLYFFYNGHADVTALMDAAGNIKATYYYDSFGNPVEETGAANNPYRYAGYQYDEETGNYYLNARYYDPKIARFLTEDTYRGRENDPLSLNLYTYCHNEPIMYIDPTGHADDRVDGGSGPKPPVDPSRILRIGARGNDVVEMQKALVSAGYKITADGIFGPQTQAALKEYQSKNGLVPDGIAGSKTYAKLYTNTQSSSSSTNTSITKSEASTSTTVNTVTNSTYNSNSNSKETNKILPDDNITSTNGIKENIIRGANDVVYFSQNDPVWGKEKYSKYPDPDWKTANDGKPQNISSSGCGPTSMAMVVSTIKSDIVTPIQMAEDAMKNSFRTADQGTAWGFFGFEAKKYDIEYVQTNNIENVKDALANGDIVIASMSKGHFTGGGHYIVLTGISEDNSTIYVNDPNDNNRSYNKYKDGLVTKEKNSVTTNADISIIKKEGKQFWIFKRK